MQPTAPVLGRLTGGNAAAGGQSRYLTSTPVATPTTPHASSAWLNLIPGAAAALSFIPGVGTAGAAALGAGGEALREKLAGEDINLGKIGTEGALSAVPFGVGRAAKLVKEGVTAAKGIEVTAKGLKAAETAAKVAPKAADAATAAQPASTFIGRAQANLAGEARGIVPGAKAVGQPQLGVEGSDKLNQFLNDVGVKGNSAKGQLADLEQKHAGWGKQIGDIINKNNKPVGATDITAVKDGFIAPKLNEIIGLPKSEAKVALVDADGKALVTTGGDMANHPYIDSLYGDLGKITDLKGLNAFRQKLDSDAIKWGRSEGSLDPDKEKIAKAFRAGVDEAVGNAIPDLKPVQNLYSQSADAQDFLRNAAKATANSGGVQLPFIGKVGGSQVAEGVQAVKSKIGAGQSPVGVPSFIGKAVNGAKMVGGYGKALAGQEITRAVADPFINGPQQPADASALPPDQLPDPNAAASPPETGIGTTGSDAIDFNAEARKILANGADAKTQAAQLDLLAKYQSIYQTANKTTTPKALSSTASQQLGNAQSGLAAISQLRSELSKNPNLANANAAAGVAGNLGRAVAGTQSYEAARGEVTDILARLRTGAAISASEEKQYKALLPTAFDTPETVSEKLSRYEALFNGIAERAQAGSPALETAGVTQN